MGDEADADWQDGLVEMGLNLGQEECPYCHGTGRHMGRFSNNDPDCPSCDGSGYEDGQHRNRVTGRTFKPYRPRS